MSRTSDGRRVRCRALSSSPAPARRPPGPRPPAETSPQGRAGRGPRRRRSDRPSGRARGRSPSPGDNRACGRSRTARAFRGSAGNGRGRRTASRSSGRGRRRGSSRYPIARFRALNHPGRRCYRVADVRCAAASPVRPLRRNDEASPGLANSPRIPRTASTARALSHRPETAPGPVREGLLMPVPLGSLETEAKCSGATVRRAAREPSTCPRRPVARRVRRLQPLLFREEEVKGREPGRAPSDAASPRAACGRGAALVFPRQARP
jgi:hypothetical protein